MSEKFQAVVIGGGPGGYVCAIRLAQLGLKTACIESRGSLGGTCLNVGCIPSKSLLNLSEEFHKVKSLANKGIEVGEVKLNLDKMMKSKDKAVTVLTKGVEFLLKKNKVTYYKGIGSFKSQNEIIIKDDQNKETIVEAEKTVIATGSVATSLPGIKIDEKVIVSSTGALKLDKVPKKMFVVEKDDNLVASLNVTFKDQLTIINDDILKINENLLFKDKVTVFGNLPYNISTEILSKWIVNIKSNFWFDCLILMFQKEVADRIIAKPNSSNYGRLSILSNWKLDIKKICDIKPL